MKNIYFEEQSPNAEELITKNIIELFATKCDYSNAFADNLMLQFKSLRKFPVLQKMFTNKLADEKFLKQTFDDWRGIMNNQETYD